MQIKVNFPEVNPAFDTYRLGTVLEMVKSFSLFFIRRIYLFFYLIFINFILWYTICACLDNSFFSFILQLIWFDTCRDV